MLVENDYCPRDLAPLRLLVNGEVKGLTTDHKVIENRAVTALARNENLALTLKKKDEAEDGHLQTLPK